MLAALIGVIGTAGEGGAAGKRPFTQEVPATVAAERYGAYLGDGKGIEPGEAGDMLFFFIAVPVPVNAASEGDERFAAAVAAAAAAVLSDRPEIVPPLAKMACSKCCCRTLRF